MAMRELEELQRIRLDEDLTYRQLGEMVGVRGQTLYQLLNTETQPLDRTLHKIQRFLDTRRSRRRRPALGEQRANPV